MSIKERWKGIAELPTDIEHKLEQLPVFLKEHGVQLVYLFGSLIRGPEANDVDLAVWSPDVPAYRLREPIVECLGAERLDLVDLQRASPVLRFEILKTGRPLYVADEAFQQFYEMMLRDVQVLPGELYEQMRGLGGFRNILVHGYLKIDPRHVYENLGKRLRIFPQYGQVILAWLDAQEGTIHD